jgi:glucose 1-dehydrogenase
MKPLVAITGGLGDIGQAIGEAFAAKGHAVAVCDLAESAPEDFSGHYFHADVRSEESVKAWFDAMEKEFGQPPTLVVANAGVHCNNSNGDSIETSVEDWTRTIEVNLTGGWLTAREGARRLLAAGKTGGITFVGSWVGQYPTADLAAYCASKAGIHSLVKTMALELSGQGIRVNEIAPGYVDAGLSGKIFKQNNGLAEKARQAVPSGQFVMPDEVARGVVYLTDPENPNLTGTTLILDGGISNMHGPQNLNDA